MARDDSFRKAKKSRFTVDKKAPRLPKDVLLLLSNTTRARTHSGPPSTGITVTMDGGVADTARANTTSLTPAVNRRSLGEERQPP